jgi:hypothetical protein
MGTGKPQTHSVEYPWPKQDVDRRRTSVRLEHHNLRLGHFCFRDHGLARAELTDRALALDTLLILGSSEIRDLF